MKIFLNRIPLDIDAAATLADALALADARPPFATAVNLQFVPKTQYAATPLQDGDQIEIIAPVTGG
ncbi:MAG: sulfur carrier protein ThiS [Polaromonas sp.]|nr:sulfur carrier protein ThiS [Polaromonas sp.]